MEDGRINEISRAIGRLESKLDGLAEDFGAERTYAHNNNHEIRNQIVVINATLAPIVKELGEIRPVINDWRNARLKASGAILVLSFVWGGFALFAHDLRGIVGRFFH